MNPNTMVSVHPLYQMFSNEKSKHHLIQASASTHCVPHQIEHIAFLTTSCYLRNQQSQYHAWCRAVTLRCVQQGKYIEGGVVYKTKRIHWLAKIDEAKMNHFPLIDFHCSLCVDSHLCNFSFILKFLGRPYKTTGTLTTLSQALPIPLRYNTTLERKFSLRNNYSFSLKSKLQPTRLWAALSSLDSDEITPGPSLGGLLTLSGRVLS